MSAFPFSYHKNQKFNRQQTQFIQLIHIIYSSFDTIVFSTEGLTGVPTAEFCVEIDIGLPLFSATGFFDLRGVTDTADSAPD